MPRYFFDIDDGSGLTEDETGLEFTTEKALRDEAIRAIAEMAKDELPDGPEHRFRVKVRSGRGEYIFQASLALTSEWLRANR